MLAAETAQGTPYDLQWPNLTSSPLPCSAPQLLNNLCQMERHPVECISSWSPPSCGHSLQQHAPDSMRYTAFTCQEGTYLSGCGWLNAALIPCLAERQAGGSCSACQPLSEAFPQQASSRQWSELSLPVTSGNLLLPTLGRSSSQYCAGGTQHTTRTAALMAAGHMLQAAGCSMCLGEPHT